MVLRVIPFLVLLSACADFPEVSQALAKTSKTVSATPALLPMEQIAASIPGARAENSGAVLASRAAALRARAAVLRAR